MNKDSGKQVLFLGAAFGDQEGHGYQGVVGDSFCAVGSVEDGVFFKEPQKQGGGDALVAVYEGVILDQKIDEMCGLFLKGGIEILTSKGLENSLKRTGQAFVAFLTKEGT